MANHLYHVTFASNLRAIAEDGLHPGGGGSFGGGYQGHAKGRLFLCSYEAVRCWWGKIEDLAHHHFEGREIVEDQRVPVLLRIDDDGVAELEHGLMEDVLGSRDCPEGESFYASEPVAPFALQVWDGERWLPVDDEDIDVDGIMARYVESADEQSDESGTWVDVELQLPEGY